MKLYFGALCWACAIVFVAIAARFGLLDRGAADVLLPVLPGIAFVTLLGGRECRPASAR